MRGETGGAPFLSARLGGLSDGGGVVDGCGREVCRGRGGGGGVIRMSLLFSCLLYRMRRGGWLRLLRLVPRFVSPSRSSVSYWRLVYSVSVCVSSGRLVMTSRRGAVSTPFVFCLCVLLVAMIDGSCRSVCLVSRFAPRLVLSVPFFLSSSERVARRGAGMWMTRRFIQLDFSYSQCQH